MPAPKPLLLVPGGEVAPAGPKPEPVTIAGLAEYVQSLVGYGSEPYGGEG